MHIVILTGAGMSADSGVDTFRDPNGAWAKHDWREVATPEGFAKDPQKVHDFYNMRRATLKKVIPNAAHHALATLEKALGENGHDFTLITQNVDDLHRRAGSQSILPMHGQLDLITCMACGEIIEWHDPVTLDTNCPHCSSKGSLRPYIVWFGENPRYMAEIDEAMQSATQFVSIGTSGTVYPAAGLVGEATHRGIPTLEINLEPSENAHLFDQGIYGLAKDKVPFWVDTLMATL
ncbi:MAG: NAD-dependent deacylase [Pseudomonadota bacterium]